MAGSDDRLAPYRVEWRPNFASRWQLVDVAWAHDEALRKMRGAARKHGGQARAVCQHVFDQTGVERRRGA